MNIQSISTQLLFTTVPIWVEFSAQRHGVGTGFFYAVPVPGQNNVQVVFLVSNRHVLEGGRRAIIEFTGRIGELPDPRSRVRVEVPGEFLTKFADVPNDLAAISIGGVITQAEQSGRSVFFRSIAPDLVPSQKVTEDLAAIEEITFIGYPSGLYDQHNATPLVRRGITATPVWNDFKGEPAFLIDAGVFPGSSGSPVFLLNEGAYTHAGGLNVGNRLLFLGVLSEAMLRQEANVPNVFLGIGKVIKAHCVRDLADRVIQSADLTGASR